MSSASRESKLHALAVGISILSTFSWPVELASLYGASDIHFKNCRILPHDLTWPSSEAWLQLNFTVNGKLIHNIPLGSPCHLPNYDRARCESLKEAWIWPSEYLSSPSTIMSPYFQNATCDPWTPKENPCILGNEPEYSIDVSSAQDVISGITFARKNNLRLVIKNTGHDYMGRSAGAGALSLWMHNLRSVEVLQYAEETYSGPALRVAAGTLAIEVYEAANSQNLRVAGGFCPTVGFAGGYIQGGGHGPLSSTYGMASGQVLEWEVVTADGNLITASPTHHSDLYWALSGGGAGTYAVVISVTVRAHEDNPVGGAGLVVSAAGHTQDNYWASFEAWQSILPALVDIGATAGYAVMKDVFFIQPITAPGVPSTEIKAVMDPFLKKMASLNVSYSLQLTDSPSFMEHYIAYSGPLPQGLFTIHHLFAGTMLQRSAVVNSNSALVSIIREIVDTTEAFLGFVALDASHKGLRTPVAPNSVQPAWEKALLTILAQYSWDYSAPRAQNVDGANLLTNFVIPKLRAFSSLSAAYLNEGDFQLKSWKQEFFGSNYARLLEVKRKYDPDGVFYAHKTVGSDRWEVNSEGRLCRIGDLGMIHDFVKSTSAYKFWKRGLNEFQSMISFS
ncbi:long-chain fatty acid-CoA ligase [Ciborinia camelliae]|nr:long-chain fatty acid-CoA ligase [Ciborinia camelliae]